MHGLPSSLFSVRRCCLVLLRFVRYDSHSPRLCRYGVLWDGTSSNLLRNNLYDKKQQRAMDCFLSLANDPGEGQVLVPPTNRITLPAKMQRIQVLAECNYNVDAARRRIMTMKRTDGDAKGLTRKESCEFQKLIFAHRKGFPTIARSLSKSVSECLVHYYGIFKDQKLYKDLKKAMQKTADKNAEMDYCAVCRQGGRLICCEECEKWYHPSCLDPPLRDIPLDDWYCPQCVRERHRLVAEQEKKKAKAKAKEKIKKKAKKKKKKKNKSGTTSSSTKKQSSSGPGNDPKRWRFYAEEPSTQISKESIEGSSESDWHPPPSTDDHFVASSARETMPPKSKARRTIPNPKRKKTNANHDTSESKLGPGQQETNRVLSQLSHRSSEGASSRVTDFETLDGKSVR